MHISALAFFPHYIILFKWLIIWSVIEFSLSISFSFVSYQGNVLVFLLSFFLQESICDSRLDLWALHRCYVGCVHRTCIVIRHRVCLLGSCLFLPGPFRNPQAILPFLKNQGKIYSEAPHKLKPVRRQFFWCFLPIGAVTCTHVVMWHLILTSSH
jgi:hypothetical protein